MDFVGFTYGRNETDGFGGKDTTFFFDARTSTSPTIHVGIIVVVLVTVGVAAMTDRIDASTILTEIITANIVVVTSVVALASVGWLYIIVVVSLRLCRRGGGGGVKVIEGTHQDT